MTSIRIIGKWVASFDDRRSWANAVYALSVPDEALGFWILGFIRVLMRLPTLPGSPASPERVNGIQAARPTTARYSDGASREGRGEGLQRSGERSHPQELLRERPNEPLCDAITFRGADEHRAI